MTEREAVVAFLREEQMKLVAAADEESTIGRTDASTCWTSPTHAALRTMVAYIERGDHMNGRAEAEEAKP